MRITVEIAEEKMRSILQLTRQKKKSPALAAALDAFLANERRKALLGRVLSGKTDYQASNDEVEELAQSVTRPCRV